MREEGSGFNNLHYHDGSTCHGFDTKNQCLENAKKNAWIGKVLEVADKTSNGKVKKCYSLISDSFAHHGKYGRYVAEVYLATKNIRKR